MSYYCNKCGKVHKETSKLGKKHLQYKTEPHEEEKPDVCPKCNGRGFIEYNAGLERVKCDCGAIPVEEQIRSTSVEQKPTKPPRSEIRCEFCNDTGLIDIGNRHRRFCECGCETWEERVGVIPRRSHLGPAKRITQSDSAEAESILAHGYGAGESDRGNISENTMQPGGTGES